MEIRKKFKCSTLFLLIFIFIGFPMTTMAAGLWSEGDLNQNEQTTSWSNWDWQTSDNSTNTNNSWSNWDWNWQTNDTTPTTNDSSTWDWNWQTSSPTPSSNSNNGLDIEWRTNSNTNTNTNNPTQPTNPVPNPITEQPKPITEQPKPLDPATGLFTPPPNMKEIIPTHPPVVENGVVLVEPSSIFEAIGSKVNRHYFPDGYSINLNGKHLYGTIGQTTIESWEGTNQPTMRPLPTPIKYVPTHPDVLPYIYLPIDGVADYLGYKPTYLPQQKVVVLGDEYFFYVNDNIADLKQNTFSPFFGTWDVFFTVNNGVGVNQGKLEIRRDGTMTWEENIQKKYNGKWAENKTEITLTNGLFGWGDWSVRFNEDGTIKIYGQGMSLVGFKKEDQQNEPANPAIPTNLEKIAINDGAYIENGRLYIHTGILRTLGINYFDDLTELYRGSESIKFSHFSKSTIYKLNGKSGYKNLTFPTRSMNRILYVPIETLKDFGVQSSYKQDQRILVLDNQYYVKVDNKPKNRN